MKWKLFLLLMFLALGAQGYLLFKVAPTVGSVFQDMFQTALLAFTIGLTLGIIITCVAWIKISKKINAYKRELEKESINSTESASQVKVLEQKIEVLEKALEQALNK